MQRTTQRTTSKVKRNGWGKNCFLLACTLVLCIPSNPAFAFKIVSPAEGTTLPSGQSVPVEVEAGREAGLVEVRYYWYPEQTEALVEQGADRMGPASQGSMSTEKYWQKDSITGAPVVALPALTSTVDRLPPYGGALPIPSDAIGRMRLLAIADISQGRLGRKTVFDEVFVTIQPAADLISIDFETEKPLQLGRTGQSSAYGHVDSLGKIFELPVVGEFVDGISRPLSSPSSGTSYSSGDDHIIKILPDGLLQIVGNGKTSLTVTNRGKQATLDVRVEVNSEPNEPPIANAGSARTVKAGTKVRLGGLQSRDPEGEALFYAWSQVRGSKVAMLDVNMPEPSFTAPYVSEQRTFRFKLRVTDKKGADSVPAYVDVTVEP
jgi:hypothetical protein